jgi:crotonyl-CoA carboxylase/reductase
MQNLAMHFDAHSKAPSTMIASIIRRDRYGAPRNAFELEEVAVPEVGPNQVLVYVMAAGINYNNVWAALGRPLDVIAARSRKGETEGYHIGGSEASGIVWAVGSEVRTVSVGDHVVCSGCRWDERAEDIRMGADPMTSSTQRVWGYEENFGAFAQLTVVDDYQCHLKPKNLSWEEAACYMLTGATAYRMLNGWAPHTLQPGMPVLIWGGSGGVGSMAIQIARSAGALPVAVVSDSSKFDFCTKLGAVGVIDRSEFDHWGRLPSLDDAAAFRRWSDGARAFGSTFWKALGSKKNPSIVVEHPGAATLPTSIYVCDTAGMIVICGATSGFLGDIDLRYLWMRQKRLQGSHFANRAQCAAVTDLLKAGLIEPCLSKTWTFAEVGEAHQNMHDHTHPPGNMAVLINAPRAGMRSLDA